MPIHYDCVRCTECCRWPGQVKLSDAEISRLATFLGLIEFDFIQRYTRLRPDRLGLSLQDKPTGECIFLEGRDRSVQAVKPQQCRDFPNGWNFPGFEKICQAVPRDVPSGTSTGPSIGMAALSRNHAVGNHCVTPGARPSVLVITHKFATRKACPQQASLSPPRGEGWRVRGGSARGVNWAKDIAGKITPHPGPLPVEGRGGISCRR